jgi:type IV pilus assembly protein PilN
MYSLDINFLQDRPEHKQDRGRGFTKPLLPSFAGSMTPLYLGLAAGLLLPTVVGAGWLFLQSQNTQLENNIAAIDAELNRLGIQEENIKKIQAQTSQTQAETRALATVFNQIRPWSTMLQDMRDRIPTTVQIQTIKQIAAATPQPAAQPSPNANANQQPAQPAPNPAGGIEISGIARSFNDVNDFLLTLKQSPFLKSTDTRIVTAELIDNPVAAASGSAKTAPVKLPQVVQYTIQSSLSDIPASELLRELERKGTLGLVTRIRTLQQRGVIQP